MKVAAAHPYHRYILRLVSVLKEPLKLKGLAHIAANANFTAQKGVHGIHLARKHRLKVCGVHLEYAGGFRRTFYKPILGTRAINHQLMPSYLKPDPHAYRGRRHTLAQNI